MRKIYLQELYDVLSDIEQRHPDDHAVSRIQSCKRMIQQQIRKINDAKFFAQRTKQKDFAIENAVHESILRS